MCHILPVSKKKNLSDTMFSLENNLDIIIYGILHTS